MPAALAHKADNYFSLKNYELAESNWLSARWNYIETDDKNNRLNIAAKLHKYYKTRGQFEKALIFHEELKMLNDSLLHNEHNQVEGSLESLLEEYAHNFSTNYDISVDFQASHIPENLSKEVKFSLFRMTQELFRNISKHAQAT